MFFVYLFFYTFITKCFIDEKISLKDLDDMIISILDENIEGIKDEKTFDYYLFISRNEINLNEIEYIYDIMYDDEVRKISVFYFNISRDNSKNDLILEKYFEILDFKSENLGSDGENIAHNLASLDVQSHILHPELFPNQKHYISKTFLQKVSFCDFFCSIFNERINVFYKTKPVNSLDIVIIFDRNISKRYQEILRKIISKLCKKECKFLFSGKHSDKIIFMFRKNDKIKNIRDLLLNKYKLDTSFEIYRFFINIEKKSKIILPIFKTNELLLLNNKYTLSCEKIEEKPISRSKLEYINIESKSLSKSRYLKNLNSEKIIYFKASISRNIYIYYEICQKDKKLKIYKKNDGRATNIYRLVISNTASNISYSLKFYCDKNNNILASFEHLKTIKKHTLTINDNTNLNILVFIRFILDNPQSLSDDNI